MFKLLMVTLSLLALASARPQTAAASASASAQAPAGAPAPAPAPAGHSGNITSLKDTRNPLDAKGGYSYDIELSDGTKYIQMGNTEAPAAGENETTIVISGSYSYIAPDGTPVNVMYIANKDGFQPTGDVIPKAPAPVGGAAPAAGAAAPSAHAAPPAASASAAATPPLAPAARPAPVPVPAAVPAAIPAVAV